MMQNHEAFMANAIRLAEKGRYTTKPNPLVGCVIVKNHQIISQGWHQVAGGAHAEIHALNNANASLEDATLYVTLEPCSHTGKTPPCVEAIISSGIKKVVIAGEDPNPLVSGNGIKQLRKAGIEVITDVLKTEAEQLNPGFFQRMQKGLPWVRCKLAMSLDGKTALASGESKWITSPQARLDVQRLRAQSSAIITGINTILADDPKLNVRPDNLIFQDADIDISLILQHQPLRVILDSNAKLQPSAKVIQMPGEVLWVTAIKPQQLAKFPQNISHRTFPDKKGKIDLHLLLKFLAELACNEVLIEAGATLSGRFFQASLIDELIVYMAPKLLGASGLSLIQLDSILHMTDVSPLQLKREVRIGDDWKFQFIKQKG